MRGQRTATSAAPAALIRKSAIAFALLLACGVLAAFFGSRLPSSFLPDEDQGYMFLNLQLPSAASLQRTEATAREIEDLLAKTPGVESTDQRHRLQPAEPDPIDLQRILFRHVEGMEANGKSERSSISSSATA